MATEASLPYPSGWFALATSAELRADTVLARRLAGREIVVFRGADGAPVVLDAYCPHLGAHMGHGGTVKDGTIVCPFHGFRFDASGSCVATGYGSKPPKAAKVACHPAGESGGFVFAWFHLEDAAPTWELPAVSLEGFTPVRASTTELRTHPQETTENSVDVGHFPFVHGYRDIRIDAVETKGPYLHTSYGFVRPEGFPGMGRNLPIEIAVHVWGLGYSYVEATLPTIGLRTRQYVLPTPVGPRLVELRLGMALDRTSARDWRLRMLPRWIFDGIVSERAHVTYVRDVMQDRHVWENKTYVARPVLADGDGPIGRYRAWCRQFYPTGTEIAAATA